ncbi:MAG: metal-sensing transcriptional repressor [Cyclobacteriaceae bacterium]
MLPKDLTKDIKTRLQSIKGQVDGLVKMLDDGKELFVKESGAARPDL